MLKHEFQDGGKLSVYDFQLYDEYDGEKSPFLAIAVYRPSPDDGFKVLGCEVTESDMQRTKFFHGMVEQVVAPPKDEKRMVVNVSLDTSGIDFGRVTKNAMRLVQLEDLNSRMIEEQDHRVAAITQRDKVIAGLEGQKEQMAALMNDLVLERDTLKASNEGLSLEREALKRQADDLRGRTIALQAELDDDAGATMDLLSKFWALVYPETPTSWGYPGEVLNHVRELIKELRQDAGREKADHIKIRSRMAEVDALISKSNELVAAFDKMEKERDYWKESAVKNAEQLTDAYRRLHNKETPANG